MNLCVEQLTNNHQHMQRVKKLYDEAFPAHERLPMRVLLKKAKKISVDFWAIYNQDMFVGFTYLVTNKGLTYVLYLAIDEHARSKGYGGQILSMIKEKDCSNRIILNIETVVNGVENYEQRVTRKKFYLRNEYTNSGLMYKDRWATYEVLLHGRYVEEQEFTQLLKKFYGIRLLSTFKPRIMSESQLEAESVKAKNQ